MQALMSYPLPRRATQVSENGFVSVPWDKPAVLAALASGGWFSQYVSHDFDGPDTSRFAGEAQKVFSTFRKGVFA